MIEDEDSDLAKETKKKIEALAMIVEESVREFVARAKRLASAVKYYRLEVPDEEICRRIRKGLLPTLHLVFEAFTLTIRFL